MQRLKLIKKYETYPEYKDSGVEWVGQIPSQWSIMPMRSIAIENTKKNNNGECQNLLSLSYGKIIEKDITSNEGLLPESFNTYQIVSNGNIVFRLTDLQNDKKSLRVGYVDKENKGIITSAYLAIILNKEINSKFAYYLLHSYDLQKVYYGMGGGVRQTLDFSNFKYLPIIASEIKEQEKIAKYLDQKMALIDQIIEKKEKQIELLKEKRSVTISKHILENTGADWDVKKIKHLVKSIESGIWGDNPLSNEDDIKCLRIADFDYDNFSYSVVETIRNNPKLQERKLLKKGDILMEKSGGGEKTPVGRAVLFSSNERMVCANFIDKIRVDKEKILPEFLVLYLSVLYACRVNTKYIKQNTGIQNMDIKEYFGESISYPDIKTQISLTEFVNAKVTAFNKAISDVEKTIEILKEFKTSLISNVVTGKIKV